MQFLDEFIFETFDEAMDVHKNLFKICREKGFVTYADIFLSIDNDEYTDVLPEIYYKYGWRNLWGAKVKPYNNMANGKWILKLPQIKLLKTIKKENE